MKCSLNLLKGVLCKHNDGKLSRRTKCGKKKVHSTKPISLLRGFPVKLISEFENELEECSVAEHPRHTDVSTNSHISVFSPILNDKITKNWIVVLKLYYMIKVLMHFFKINK